MKKSVVLFSVVSLTLIASLGIARAQKASMHKTVYATPDKADFKEMAGTKEVSTAVIWGDPEKGAHGTYTKFAPTYDAGLHTHTSDILIVGIKGAYIYKDDAGEKRIGPGDFLKIPGGHKHTSKADPTEGALFYEQGSGKFDRVPVK
jgi:quercetin dioxygenase-like cupin family protein